MQGRNTLLDERLSQMVVMSVFVALAVCVLMYGLYEIIANDITI